MYCYNCGKEISENSRFCKYCGIKQSEVLCDSEEIKKKYEFNKDVFLSKAEAILGFKISNLIIGIYLLWVLIHLVLLFIGWNSYSGVYKFWPFAKDSELNSYDLTEFFFFIFIPIFILIIVNLLKSKKNDLTHNNKKQTLSNKGKKINEERKLFNDYEHREDKYLFVLGIIMLIISIIVVILFVNLYEPYYSKNLWDPYYLKNESSIWIEYYCFGLSLAFRIGISIWIYNISKRLNINSFLFIILSLLLPSLTMIITGYINNKVEKH
ncbi:MAG: zinc ribbon domain-containing protein [Bacteroidales bacterium]|nr:zinc ribbon domain-containing protein [Bacteroidales bacterium]